MMPEKNLPLYQPYQEAFWDSLSKKNDRQPLGDISSKRQYRAELRTTEKLYLQDSLTMTELRKWRKNNPVAQGIILGILDQMKLTLRVAQELGFTHYKEIWSNPKPLWFTGSADDFAEWMICDHLKKGYFIVVVIPTQAMTFVLKHRECTKVFSFEMSLFKDILEGTGEMKKYSDQIIFVDSRSVLENGPTSVFPTDL